MGTNSCTMWSFLLFWFAAFSYVAAGHDDVMPISIDEEIRNELRLGPKHSGVANTFDNDTVLVELDIMITKKDWEKMQKSPSKRTYAVTFHYRRWTNGVVPYVLDDSWSDSYSKRNLEAAFNAYNTRSCLKFVPRTNQKQYLFIGLGNGCNSFVGMIRAKPNGQKVNLGWGCRSEHTITHELGHAVGFHHEQCRHDRDQYINLHLENVPRRWHYAFNKKAHSSGYVGVGYDYGSIMQYGQYAFSNTGNPSIITKDPAWQNKIGKAPTLSFSNLKVLNHIYKCADHCGNKKCPSNGYLDKNCRCMCKGPSATVPVKPCACKRK